MTETQAPTPSFLALQSALAGRYALVRELGRGGMGVVYLARDLALDRPVAVKLLPPSHAAIEGRRRRFLREARTAARLSHPHIVPIHSVEEHGEFALFVMAYVEGETLAERVRRAGPLPVEEGLRVLQEVAWALAYAHRHGVVHRDVKPDNILLERGSGRALVTDFGIAQVDDGSVVSGGHEIAGTARYMSPEQATGEPLDGRSDLYSLGVTAFEALTGRACPRTAAGSLLLPPAGDPPSIASLRPDLPSRLDHIVERCLAHDAAARFGSGEELAEALDAVRSRRRPVPVAIQRYREHFESYSGEVASYASIGVVLGVQTVLGELLLEATIFPELLLYIGAAVALLLGFRSAALVRRTRDLLGEGYGVGDLLASVEADPPAPAPPRPLARRALRAAGVVGWLALFWGWTQVDSAAIGPLADALWYALVTIPPLVWIKNGIARMLKPPSRRRGWWSKWWWTVMTRKIFFFAGGKRAAAGAAGLPEGPTEVALGDAAQQVFERLPPALRERFGDVPDMVERLEGVAAELRARTQRGQAGDRLPGALAALEAIRLDLLRLEAGVGRHEELTADLEAARQIGERVDALLEAHRELERPTPTPA